MYVILPDIVIVPGIAGVFWGLRLKKHRPEIYRGIGFGGAPDNGRRRSGNHARVGIDG